jgi:hypothetical protein
MGCGFVGYFTDKKTVPPFRLAKAVHFREAVMSEIFNFEKSPLGELRDMLPGTEGFDFGTSPHGLSADLLESSGENLEAENLQFHGDQQGEAAQKRPKIYSDAEVRRSCRHIRGSAAAGASRHASCHTLRMTDVEFLHLVFAVENARNKTRKAVAKGLADFEDLQATRSLWDKLQVLRAHRMRGHV